MPTTVKPTTYQVFDQNSAKGTLCHHARKVDAIAYAHALAGKSNGYAISVWDRKGVRILFLTDCAS